ncbi:MAG: response regulator containing a CheY-like receiver domain and an DNA-binding domain [Myxococcales bacterium]|nr:response regulator containing a CheY-like receiver domain and an DNA-binding domain [Myxococcales bacterium]
MTRTRIILVDDHRLFRDGLRAILGGYPDLAVVGEASDFREAADLLEHLESDLIILDITLPGSNGLALLRELKRRQQRQPVLILTMHQHADLVTDAFAAGATGYALKHQSEEELIEAVRATAGRATYLAPQLSRDLLPDHTASTTTSPGILSLLSSREREIFDLIVRGHTNAAMAKQLFISVKTIETHRTRIMRKLDVHNVGELIRLAARHGLLAA